MRSFSKFVSLDTWNQRSVNEVSKMSILRLMSRDREEVIGYLNEYNTSLKDEQDLIKLTSFCNNLVAKK